jgi:hypothetical protein
MRLSSRSRRLTSSRKLRQRLVDGEQEAIHLERLDQEVVRAQLDRADGRVDRPERGDGDDVGAGLDRANLAQQIQSVDLRHLHVGYHQVDAAPPDPLKAGATVVGELDRETFALQIFLEIVAHGSVVVDDQDGGPSPHLDGGNLVDHARRAGHAAQGTPSHGSPAEQSLPIRAG